MDSIWNWTWSWGWCLLPMIFFGVIAFAFLLGGARCGCACGRARKAPDANSPGSVAQ